MLKQNQSLYRPFPGEQVALKPHDHLTNHTCHCQICQRERQKLNPQITLDEKYQLLKTQKSKMLSAKSSTFYQPDKNDIEDFDWYLKKLAFQCKTLPDFPILDVMVMDKGQMSFYIYFENGKSKLHLNTNTMKSSQNTQKHSQSKVLEYVAYSLNGVKNKILERKFSCDIEYQKAKHKELHPSFEWAQLDHDSEKLIKQFEKKLKFIDQVLNRVAIVKQFQRSSNEFFSMTRSQEYRLKESMISTVQQQESQKVLSRYEFSNLFDHTRMKVCELEEICYIQMFPIMYGEEQQSYVKQVKYFRQVQSCKWLFKQAQTYVLAWLEKNQTLQKMEQKFIEEYFYCQKNLRKLAEFPHTHVKRLSPASEEEYLMYQSYKSLLHLQTQTNIQISQCLLQFLTPNNGHTFYLKSIKHIKYQQKHQVQVKQNKLPTYKHIQKQDYIDDLQKQMREMFEKVEYQFERLNKDWQQFESKTKNDRNQSDKVFKEVRGFKQQTKPGTDNKQHQLIDMQKKTQQEYLSGEWLSKAKLDDDEINLHRILQSNDQKYKEEMLGLNHKFKFSETKLPSISKSLRQSKTSKK